jgi:hypothetical protein
VVRTISFKLLYGLVILRHARRQLVAINVTSNPTERIAGQVAGAYPWDEAPRHLFATVMAPSALHYAPTPTRHTGLGSREAQPDFLRLLWRERAENSIRLAVWSRREVESVGG